MLYVMLCYMLITHLYELTDFKNPNAIKINQNPLIIEKPLKNCYLFR